MALIERENLVTDIEQEITAIKNYRHASFLKAAGQKVKTHFKVLTRSLNQPPVTPTEGDHYLTALEGAITGAWAAFGNGAVVVFQTGAWRQVAAAGGDFVYIVDEGAYLSWRETSTEIKASNALSDGGVLAPAADGVADLRANVVYTLTDGASYLGFSGLRFGESAYLIAPTNGSAFILDAQTVPTGVPARLTGGDVEISADNNAVIKIIGMVDHVRIQGAVEGGGFEETTTANLPAATGEDPGAAFFVTDQDRGPVVGDGAAYLRLRHLSIGEYDLNRWDLKPDDPAEAVNNMVKIQEVLDEIANVGYGKITVPMAMHYIDNLRTRQDNWNNDAAIWLLNSNIHFKGQSKYGSGFIMADDSIGHTIKVGQWNDGDVRVGKFIFEDLEIDCNRDNRILPDQLGPGEDHWHAIDISSYCGDVDILRTYLHNCQYYAVGFQRTGIYNSKVFYCHLWNTGADLVDHKNDDNDGFGVRVSYCYGGLWGQASTLSNQAGIDLRPGAKGSKILLVGAGQNAGAQDLVGFRSQRATSSYFTIAEPVSFEDCGYVSAVPAGHGQGFRLASYRSGLSDCFAIAASQGLVHSSPESHINGFDGYRCNTAAFFQESTDADGDNCTVEGFRARDCPNRGLFLIDVFGTSLHGPQLRGNGTNLEISAGTQHSRFVGGSITAATTTNITDASTPADQNVFDNVSGIANNLLLKSIDEFDAVVEFATPGATPAAITYTRQRVHVERTRERVTFMGELAFTIDSKNDSTGEFRIAGFADRAGTDQSRYAVSMARLNNITLPASVYQIDGIMNNTQRNFHLRGARSGLAALALTIDDFPAGTLVEMEFHGDYVTDDL